MTIGIITYMDNEKDKNLYSPQVSVRNAVPKYYIAVISACEELRRLGVRGDTPRLLVVPHQQTAHLGVGSLGTGLVTHQEGTQAVFRLLTNLPILDLVG